MSDLQKQEAREVDLLHGIRFLRKLNHPEGLVYACFDSLAKVRSTMNTSAALFSHCSVFTASNLVLHLLPVELHHAGRQSGALLQRGRPIAQPGHAAHRRPVRPHSARAPARRAALALHRLEIRAQRRSGREEHERPSSVL